MVDLDFAVENLRFEPCSASPLLLFGLCATNKTPKVEIRNVSLQCQLRIEPARRRYCAEEHERLVDLFGEPERWGESLQSFLWTHTSVSIPPFQTDCRVDLPVPCSYDFNIAATKYFHGLEIGDAPVSLLFSGSVFYRGEDGGLQIEQIAWTKHASYRLPVGIWRAMMDHHYPDSAWLRLERSAFERLYAYRRSRGLPSFELALASLLEGQEEGAAP